MILEDIYNLKKTIYNDIANYNYKLYLKQEVYKNTPNLESFNVSAFTEYLQLKFKRSIITKIVGYNDEDIKNEIKEIWLGIVKFPIDINNPIIILINENCNRCLKRFVNVKELCSIFIELSKKNDNLNSKNNITLHESLEEYIKSEINNFSKNPFFLNYLPQLSFPINDEEFFALILAIELMVCCNKLNAFIDSHISSKIKYTNFDYAKALLIPEFVLNSYLKSPLFNLCLNH